MYESVFALWAEIVFLPDSIVASSSRHVRLTALYVYGSFSGGRDNLKQMTDGRKTSNLLEKRHKIFHQTSWI